MKTMTDLYADVERIRARRGELAAKRTGIDRAPVSLADATGRIDRFLDELAAAPGGMAHRFLRPSAGSNDLAESTLGMMDGPGRGIAPRDVMRALAFVGRENLRRALVADAKAGIDALTRTLALEWAPDRINVNAIAPGPIPTEGVKKAFTRPGARDPDVILMDAFVQREIPAGRWGTPEDIGHMVTYLASPAGDWITGAILVVDGGQWLAGGRPGTSTEQP